MERTFVAKWITPVMLSAALLVAPWTAANAQDSDAADDYADHEHTPGDGVLYGPEEAPEAPASSADSSESATESEPAQRATQRSQEPTSSPSSAPTSDDTQREEHIADDAAQESGTQPVAQETDTQAEDTDADADADDAQGAHVEIGEGGLKVSSADGRHALGLTPFVQMGYRQVASDVGSAQESGFVLEHFRPILSGKYNDILSYNFILQITPSNINILNAFVTFHAHPAVNIRVGLQKPVFGIELRQAQHHLLFYNRSLASTIGAARDIGIALDLRPIEELQFEIGAYNGTQDTQVFSGIQEKSVAGDAGVRWYALGNDRPATKDEGFLTLGAAALLRRNEGTPITARNSVGGHTYVDYASNAFADGRKFASNVFAHGGYKGLYFQGEFTTSNQQVNDGSDRGRIVEHAWQASATYTLGGVTGWTGTTPDRSLFDGGLGALEIKARGHGLNARSRDGDFLEIGGAPADSLSAIGASAGLSWHISQGLRVQADYNWTTFGADGDRIDKANEHVFFLGLTAGY